MFEFGSQKQQEWRNQALFGYKAFLGVFIPFTTFQILAFKASFNADLLDSTSGMISTVTNFILTGIVLLVLLLERRFHFSDKTLYRLSLALVALVIFGMLIHIHLVGSQNSLILVSILATALVVSWFVSFRDTLLFFIFGNLGIALLTTLEIKGLLPYAPLLKNNEALQVTFLDWRAISMNFAVYFVLSALVLITIFRFQNALRRQTTELLNANEALRNEIDQRRKIEDALRESEEKTRTLVDTLPDIVMQTDLFGNVTYMSDAGLRLGRGQRQDVQGINMFDFIDETDHARVIENYQKMFERYLGPIEYRIRRIDGTFFDGEVNGDVIRSKNGEAHSLLFVIRDISERKNEIKEKAELIEKLQNALEDVKTLKGLLPICASCKRIRDDRGYWNQLESYVSKHTDASFTHSICPECAQKLYPEIMEDKK